MLERFGTTRKTLVITEDWCGTSIAALPYVFKLAEADPRVELRVFLRDQKPDLMDQYLKEGLARFIEGRPAWGPE